MAHFCQVVVQIFNKVLREFYFKSLVAAESRAVLYLWLKSVAVCNCPYGILLQNSFYFEDGRITMEKEITLSEFADELTARLDKGKTVDCCKAELLRLAVILKAKLPEEKILVTWKED
jgi:hypothetical protein